MVCVSGKHFVAVTFVLLLTGVTANTQWQSCVGKCYHLGDQMSTFDNNQIYCRNFSDAIPVEFGDVLADTVAQRLTPCKLNFQEEKPYWMDKTSMNTLCRTVSFKDSVAKFNQQADCSQMAYSFCEKKSCQATVYSGLKYNWIEENNLWYKVSETAQHYSESLKYCQDRSASLAIPGTYQSVTLLGMALGISPNSSSISFWVNSTGGTCHSGATDPACVLTYTNLIVHSVSAKGIHETYPALCQAEYPYTTTTQIATISTTIMKTTTTPQKTTTLTRQTRDWVQVSGSGKFYRLSDNYFTYCEGRMYCKKQLNGQLARIPKLPYSLGNDLAVALKLTSNENLTIWINSPVIGCTQQDGQAYGTIMTFTAPLVHLFRNKNLTEKLLVLCEGAPALPLSSSSSSYDTSRPPLPTHPTQASSVNFPTLPPPGTPQLFKSTTSSSATYSTPYSTTKLNQHGSTIFNRGQLAVNQTHPATPINMRSKSNVCRLAVERSSEPEWMEIGSREYLVNQAHTLSNNFDNSSVDYYKIMPLPENQNQPTAKQFWVAAHVQNQVRLDESKITYRPCKTSLVQFSLTNQEVQGLWRDLRSKRNMRPTKGSS